jgi:hypothetical protein
LWTAQPTMTMTTMIIAKTKASRFRDSRDMMFRPLLH